MNTLTSARRTSRTSPKNKEPGEVARGQRGGESRGKRGIDETRTHTHTHTDTYTHVAVACERGTRRERRGEEKGGSIAS